MQYVIVTILDKKVGAYGRPFPARTNAEAVRIFQDEVNNPTNAAILRQHAEDYSLWNIGTYDDEGPILTGLQPTFLAEAQNLVRE